MRPIVFVFALAALVACSEDPAARPPPSTGADASATTTIDATTTANADASPAADDASAAADTGVAPPDDAGAGAPDADPMMGGPDAAAPDATVIGPPPDDDMDGIPDAVEGDGLVDTDMDGTPDSRDSDSDDDGIPDAVEAGDADPISPPIDSDTDGTPDFRDDDSDGDGLPDLVEGLANPDNDALPAYRDDDSDGDGLPDLVEGTGNPDMDALPSFLDDDSDGDGILDAVEGTTDPDMDQLPSYLDDDSDGDGVADLIEGAGDVDLDGLKNFIDTDSDGDGIDDAVEGALDPDQDGAPSYLDVDSDGDFVPDALEGLADPDIDMIPSYLDDDSDGDAIPDRVEAGDLELLTPPVDTDFDMTPDFLDLDSDGDNVSDRDEGVADTDSDQTRDSLDLDSDGDGLLDILEEGDGDLATRPFDTDTDGTPDFRDEDSDGDTLLDAQEGPTDRDTDMIPSFRDLDSDGDGVLDRVEAGDADPLTPAPNSDRDQLPDFLDTDSDDDGLGDRVELGCPGSSSRTLADSDADGFLDPAEVAFGSSPCSASSVIDGFYFVLPPLDPPQRAPLDFSDTDIDRADVAFNVDTTGSMGEEIANLRTSLSSAIIPGIDARIADAAFGVARFDDFPIDPFGSAVAGDVPFALHQRITTNAQAAQSAVNQLTTHEGDDLPESGLEALFQIATGAGLSYPGGSVPAFNPNNNRVPGVADGTIGGVGFRTDAFPVIVHITDAISHQRPDYVAVNAGIGATATSQIMTSLDAIGARVVGIASVDLPNDPGTAACTHASARILGNIRAPAGSDVDYFELVGATAGQAVTIEAFGVRAGAPIDTMVALMNSTGIIATNDDIAGSTDSRLTANLSGAGPYYVAVTAYNDPDFNGSGGGYVGHYLLDVSVVGTPFTTQVTQCRVDDANSRASATRLVSFATATAPANTAQCQTDCDAILARQSLPYGMAERTGAVIPTCAWDRFGGGRPAGCGANQCCTGVNGAGIAPNGAGLCPLSFQITNDGAGLGNAVVAGIEALVRFSAFTVTTVVRPDPVELQATGFDTTCFIHGVVPVSATPQACAPTPRIVDLVPPVGVNDSFENVAPGTALSFDVNAENRSGTSGNPCRPRGPSPQLYRAYIDVLADGVTVVDTRDVIIIVPPEPPMGSN